MGRLGTIRTTCAYCGVGCGISAQVTGPRSVSIKGDAAHPANAGRLCSKGTHLGETVGLEGRLLQPMIGDAPASWDSALDAVAGRMRDTIAATTPQGYLGCVEAISRMDFIADLPSVKIPVLVVCGSDDEGTPPAGNKRIAALVANGRYAEIARARHFPNVEHPGVFNGIMLGWLDQQRKLV